MKAFLTVVLILYSLTTYTQNNTIDSLQKVLQTEKEDTNKVNTLNELSKKLWYPKFDYKNALQNAEKALSLAEKINFKKGEGNAYVCIGSAYEGEDNYPEALKNYFAAKKIFEETGNKHWSEEIDITIGSLYCFQLDDNSEALKFYDSALRICKEIGEKKFYISRLYDYIGSAYFLPGNFSEALENYYSALKLAEEIGNKALIAISSDAIGDCYSNQGNYPEALKNTQVALKTYQEEGDKISTAKSYCKIGNFYSNMNKYPEALTKYLAAKKIFEESGMPNWGIAMCQLSLGSLYVNMGEQAAQSGDKTASKEKFSKAKNEFLLALKLYKKIDSKVGLAGIYGSLGDVNLKLNNFSAAKYYLEKGLQLSREIMYKGYLSSAYNSLSTLDSVLGNYKQAYKDYRMYILYRDSMVNEESTKKSLQIRMQYEFDKKETLAKATQDKKDALTIAEIKNQKIIRNFSYAGTFAVFGFAGYGFYRFRRRKKLQSQQEMLNERLRIGRELHDDIGSTLGSISIYSEVAKNRSEKNENAEEAISKIGNASRELIDKMSDIVWSLNPDNESFEQLLNRMQVFAAIILTPHEILYDIYTDEEVKNLKLTTEERKNIYLIYKEAIHNIIKYADCSQVEIKLLLDTGEFSMSIKDNGKGFNVNQLQNINDSLGGNGIKNMQARAESIHGRFNIQASINKGTIITLDLKI